MKFDAYIGGFYINDLEVILNSFRSDRGWNGYDLARKIKDSPLIWEIGSFADNGIGRSGLVRLDDNRIICTQVSPIVKEILMKNRISHSRYYDFEIDKEVVENGIAFSLVFPKGNLDYKIDFEKLK